MSATSSTACEAPGPPPRRKRKVAFVDDAAYDSAEELEVGLNKPTPTKMATSTSSHTNDEIHPYVANDLLNCHAVVPLYAWIEAVCHINKNQLIDRMARIKVLDWFSDEVIQDALVTFASHQ